MQKDSVITTLGQKASDQKNFGELLTPQEREYLLENGMVRSVQKNECICRRNQLDARAYILVIGEVEVSQEQGFGKVVLSRLSHGSLFGEISALFKTPRLTDVTAIKPSVILEIPAHVIEKIVYGRQELQDIVIEMYKRRVTDTALHAIPAFRGLSGEMTRYLETESSLLSVPAGNPLVREGEQGDALYVIIHGMARVSHGDGDNFVSVALLRAGDYFGEWSLMTGAPRTATVTAITRMDVIRINCQLFLEFMQKNPEIRDRMDMVAHNRCDVLEEKQMIPECKNHIRLVVSEIESMFDQNKAG